MSSLSRTTTIDGHRWVPLLPSERGATIRTEILCRVEAKQGGGQFFLLRQTRDARVYLGALCSKSGCRDLVEIWIQNVPDGVVADSFSDSNLACDARWDALLGSMACDADFLGILGAEDALAPVVVDLNQQEPVRIQLNGSDVALCRDDAALTAAGLEPYGSSAARFARNQAGQFVRLGAESAEFRALVPPGAVSVNSAAGPMFARKFAPLSVWEFAGLLSGKSWPGLMVGKSPVRLAGAYSGIEDIAKPRISGAHFFSGGRDFAGRLAEVLCLKLVLIEQCVRLAAGETERSELPFLNFGEDSFRVELGDIGQNLPFFWAFKTSLSHPSGAVAHEFPATREKFFAPREEWRGSVYRPTGGDERRKGTGTLRLKKVFLPAENGIAIEGTLATQERIGLSPNEVIRLYLPFEELGRLQVFANLDPKSTMTPKEIAFRSIPTILSDERAAMLRSFEGTVFSQVEYEISLPLSSPADIYALGVSALRVLFSGSGQTLSTLVNAAQSMLERAGELSLEHRLEARVLHLFESDDRWKELLGPQYLSAGTPDCLPIEIWSRVFAAILPFFPGRPDSFARDLADAESLAPHLVYDGPIRALENAVRSAKAVFLSDWRRNEEMADVLASYLPPR